MALEAPKESIKLTDDKYEEKTIEILNVLEGLMICQTDIILESVQKRIKECAIIMK